MRPGIRYGLTMLWLRRSALAVAAMALATGCGLALGVSDFDAAGTGGTGGTDAASSSESSATVGMQSSSAVGGGAGCPAGATCAPLADGWTPVHMFLGEGEPPACAGDAASVFDGGTEPTSEPHTCGCNCGAPKCSDAIFLKSDATCSGNQTLPVVAAVSCTNLIEPFLAGSGYAVEASSCGASSTVPTLPPVEYENRARLCHTPTSTACAPGQACVPDAPQGFRGPCVYRPDPDALCPAGYPAREVLSRVLTDDRGCGECTCTPGTSCAGHTYLYSQPNCGPQSTATPLSAADNCKALMVPAVASVVYVPNQVPSCTVAKAAEPVGMVAYEEITVCCAGESP